MEIDNNDSYLTKTQLSSLARGWSVGKGSGVMTSKPAAKILPSFNADTRSSWKKCIFFGNFPQKNKIKVDKTDLTWLMIPPLLVLIRMLELFIRSKALELKRCCSSGEKAQVTRTKSDTWGIWYKVKIHTKHKGYLEKLLKGKKIGSVLPRLLLLCAPAVNKPEDTESDHVSTRNNYPRKAW